jgi:hypothetical protein
LGVGSVADAGDGIMIKLYRREAGKIVLYHEAWLHGSIIIEHWGKLGEPGETREQPRNIALSDDENLTQVLAKSLAIGYETVDDHAILLVEYLVKGMGTKEDLDKRHALEDRLNELLGWTGNGHCDGGSIGSGTMDVCCFVVDFETAKRVIEEGLNGTPFADYNRIYNEAMG